MKPAIENFAVERARALEDDAGAGFQLLARVHERFPSVVLGAADEQTLHGPAARDAAAEKPRWKYPGIVDDEDIARFEKLRKRGDGSVADRAGCTFEEKHARGVPLRGGLLRN